MATGVNGTTGGIGSWPTRRAFLSGDRIALIDGDCRITYTEFDRRTDQLARALREIGVRQGDRVAALMVNSAAFMETMFATAKLGAVFVPINFRLSPPEAAFLLADSGADVFVWSSTRSRSSRCYTATRQSVRSLWSVCRTPTGGRRQSPWWP
jgi:fatty-acyl-CoA synthase